MPKSPSAPPARPSGSKKYGPRSYFFEPVRFSVFSGSLIEINLDNSGCLTSHPLRLSLMNRCDFFVWISTCFLCAVVQSQSVPKQIAEPATAAQAAFVLDLTSSTGQVERPRSPMSRQLNSPSGSGRSTASGE